VDSDNHDARHAVWRQSPYNEAACDNCQYDWHVRGW